MQLRKYRREIGFQQNVGISLSVSEDDASFPSTYSQHKQ